MTDQKKTIRVIYHAMLREQSGKSEETLSTPAKTALELYRQLQNQYNFTLNPDYLKVAINDEYQEGLTQLNDGDNILFIPPIAGG